ncbi:MAG TPA: PGPGW domain-containing protein [Candidatus Nanoarchaeia archaeon]|nr:PGPGW domain-containing protein [Candidatus Nanoarchaeia archaeon]
MKALFHLAKRGATVTIGSFFLGIGIIMIFTPGPAIVFIPLGIALLATEFHWARKIKEKITEKFKR